MVIGYSLCIFTEWKFFNRFFLSLNQLNQNYCLIYFAGSGHVLSRLTFINKHINLCRTCRISNEIVYKKSIRSSLWVILSEWTVNLIPKEASWLLWNGSYVWNSTFSLPLPTCCNFILNKEIFDLQLFQQRSVNMPNFTKNAANLFDINS